MKLVFIILLLFLASCTKNTEDRTVYEEGEVLKTSKEFQIPRDLKERIQKDYIAYIRDTMPDNTEEDEKLISQLPREFLEVDVYLKELNAGTLNHNTIFRAPRGGGLVDLSESVLGEKGSFFVRFILRDPQNPDEELENLKAFYLSEVKEKKIDEKTYGSGCGSLVDITDPVLDSATGSGIRVNAKDDRYFHSLAGTYIFVNYAYEKIRLAALRLKDTSITGFECPGKN